MRWTKARAKPNTKLYNALPRRRFKSGGEEGKGRGVRNFVVAGPRQGRAQSNVHASIRISASIRSIRRVFLMYLFAFVSLGMIFFVRSCSNRTFALNTNTNDTQTSRRVKEPSQCACKIEYVFFFRKSVSFDGVRLHKIYETLFFWAIAHPEHGK